MTAPALLLHFDSTPIVDSSGNNIPLSAGYNAKTSVANPRIGPQSMVCDSQSYILASDARLAIGIQDFYFSIYAYFHSLAGNPFVFDSRNGPGTAYGFAVVLVGGLFTYYDGAAFFNNPAFVAQIDTWYFIEVSRIAGHIKFRVNGLQVIEFDNPTNLVSILSTWGAGNWFPQGVQPMLGNIDEGMLIIGSGLPPGSPTPLGKLHSGMSNFSRFLKVN